MSNYCLKYIEVISKTVRIVFDKFFLLIIPSLCAYCKSFLSHRAVLCTECEWKIFPIVSKQVDITASFSVTVYALSDYKDPLKKMILAKRWSDIVASAQLGELIWKQLPLESLDYDVITSVPLHWTRYAVRGFNQAEEIARVLHKKRRVPLIPLLKRIKKTTFQFDLPASSRGANLKSAFVVHDTYKEHYKDKHILLIDDLMTTGATIREAAKELLKLRPKKITVVVVCRVI